MFLVEDVIKVHRIERVQRVYGVCAGREQRSGLNEEKEIKKNENYKLVYHV